MLRNRNPPGFPDLFLTGSCTGAPRWDASFARDRDRGCFFFFLSFSKLFDYSSRAEYSSSKRSSFHSRLAIQESEKSTCFLSKRKKERKKIVRKIIIEIQLFRLHISRKDWSSFFILFFSIKIFRVFEVRNIKGN